MQRGIAKKKIQDIDGAIKLFSRAVSKEPHMARPHLELGLLYDREKEAYVRAIYHYQRYLELRPDSEKRERVEDLKKRKSNTASAY